MFLNVCVFGVSGYTGSKLLYYLNKHKKKKFIGVFGTSKIGENLNEIHPTIKNLPKLIGLNYFAVMGKIKALPSETFQKRIVSPWN